MEDILISMGITVILAAIKNPNKKASLRAAMLKVFRAIQSAYHQDEDFQ